MPLPRATRGNVYNISGPRVRLKWKVCAIAMDKTSVDNEVFSRALVLKGKGERKDSKKQKEPTYRLRQHLFKGKKLSALVKDNGSVIRRNGTMHHTCIWVKKRNRHG